MSEEENKVPPTKRIILFVLTVGAVLLLCGGLWFDSQAKVKRTYNSPDGKYSLELLAYPRFVQTVDDNSGPGKVRLVTADGVIIDQQPIDNVSQMKEPQWKSDQVSVGDSVIFPLPESAPAK